MRRLFPICCSLWMALTFLASCEHKELEYKHPHTTEVRVDVDWSRFTPYETPTGMTLMLYPQSADGNVVTHLSNTTSQAILNLPADRFHMLVFNQSISEFGTISFQGLDKQQTAMVVANEYTSRWYMARNDNEKVVTNPEWLGVGNVSGAEVTQAMIDAEVEAMLRAGTGNSLPTIASIVPVNIVSTVKIRLRIRGIQNLRSARAALNGMAEGYLLTSMRPTKGKVTHLMEEWTMKRDEADPTMGVIETSFTCFGLPDGHHAGAEENLLSLSLLLVDNKTIRDYSFNVGDRFTMGNPSGENSENNPNQGGVYLEMMLDYDTEITLPDVTPEGGSAGGFDAEVEDWGDEEEYELNI
ncbi:MAG: DUF5119 domain-containing protein [Proteiniphilum sp.]|nr:DUF5119 domain-containing protein [Proteiniphilum sp.]